MQQNDEFHVVVFCLQSADENFQINKNANVSYCNSKIMGLMLSIDTNEYKNIFFLGNIQKKKTFR